MLGICEVCEKEKNVEKHHIHSKCDGGSDHPRNIAKLCGDCHSKVHMITPLASYGIGNMIDLAQTERSRVAKKKRRIILEGKWDTTQGVRLVWRYEGEPSVTEVPDIPVWIHTLSRVVGDTEYYA